MLSHTRVLATTTLPLAPGADALDDEFRVGGFVAVGQGDVGDGDVREAYGALAYGSVHTLADGLEHQQAHGRDAYSGFGKNGLVWIEFRHKQ